MAHIRRANIKDDKANHEAAPGYTVNGAGEWTRMAASAHKVRADGSDRSRFDSIIAKNFRELRKLEQRVRTEPDPAIAGGLMRKIELKLEIIDRVREQQQKEEQPPCQPSNK